MYMALQKKVFSYNRMIAFGYLHVREMFYWKFVKRGRRNSWPLDREEEKWREENLRHK